jgi:hypothetical protein
VVEILEKKGWIVAGPRSSSGTTRSRLPLGSALAKVKGGLSHDDRRIVLVGYNAGANMAWRMGTRQPETGGDHRGQRRDRRGPKPAEEARGEARLRVPRRWDTQSYTVPMLTATSGCRGVEDPRDYEVRPDWAFDF